MSGTEVIEPTLRRTVHFMGADIEVRPLVVGQIPGVTQALKDIAKSLDGELDIADLIRNHSGALADAVSVAARIERAKIDEAALDEFIELATAVFEVNSDFFVQRVAPLLSVAIEKVASRFGTGAIPSKP